MKAPLMWGLGWIVAPPIRLGLKISPLAPTGDCSACFSRIW